MKQICGLKKDPLFCPVVDDYYSGMATSILLEADMEAVHAHWPAFTVKGWCMCIRRGYDGNISANAHAGSDQLELIVCGRKNRRS
ncbi:MAG: hypothetical protein ACLVJ6_04590 [Merdibacter sp.]